MKPHHPRHWPALVAGILCLLLCAAVAPLAAAEVAAAPTDDTGTGTSADTSTGTTATATSGTSTSTASGSQVAIESTTLNPGTFFTGDTGTLTVKVANHGNSAVRIQRAAVASNEFEFLNTDTYTTVGTLEAGSSRELTFTLRADAGNGVYYPEVEIDLGDAGSIRYAVPIRIDNSEIEVSLANAPDSYMKDQKNAVTIAVFNPRQNTVNGVTVTAAGTNLTVSDTAGFVGALAADQTRNVTFQVTPQDSTVLTLTVSYQNGLTDHSTVLTVPMTVDGRSTAADPVVNGVEMTNTGGKYTLSGDVTNAGINDARGVVVTVGSPATPVDPNRNYVVGSLAADDFASFELTFTAAGARTVPLLVQYKDDDGKAYEKTVEVTLSGSTGTNASAGAASGASVSGGFQNGAPAGGSGGGIMFGLGGGRQGSSAGGSSLPILPIAGVLVVLVVLGVAWRKGWVAKARTRFRK
ncbi:MAG: CARDB domain-containing protein [Methanospirillum sp.]